MGRSTVNKNYTHVTREHQFLAESVGGKYEDRKMVCLAQTHAEETKQVVLSRATRGISR